MASSLAMAWQYLIFYRGRTSILVAALTLILSLPMVARLMIFRFEQSARFRSESTPLLVGTKGSRFGLVMHSLYFRGETPATLTESEQKRIDETGLAKTIPLHIKFTAQGIPIAGTTNRYFEFRGLAIHEGKSLQRLGDCLLGARAARILGLKPGDSLLSDPENLFDLSGPSPLRMRVVGILAPNGTADDDVVWCDRETTWIIEGIGHGHSQISQPGQQEHQHSASRENLNVYQEVTDENWKQFHFHGRRSEYPLTAVIALPNSERDETILIGKYLGQTEAYQIVRPVEVVAELMETVSKLRGLFELGLGLLTLAAMLLFCLVLLLSLRLRQRETRTMHLLGCSRGTIALMMATEWGILGTVSLAIALTMTALSTLISDSWILRLIH